MMQKKVPLIDISSLHDAQADHQAVVDALRQACREYGFFYLKGHAVPETLQARLEDESKRFFALPQAEKMKIRMALGGKAWRGYFPVGDELTSGRPDLKEGLYLGTELGPEHPKVKAAIPMHGVNLFPEGMPEFRETILAYITAMTELGHLLMKGISLSLGLQADHFSHHYTMDPLTLFRIFHYPAANNPSEKSQWGVGEHTDYGLLTILKQDETGGLQIKSQDNWLEAPFIPNTFVCNIGDMLERLTKGIYVSTPHRVRNRASSGRLSYPFFFDPSFDAMMKPLPIVRKAKTEAASRWDGANVHDFDGTYGEYLLEKVAKVFPEL
ncbi:MAG: 2-oxoglutarate and iron-dependent oxygenase domain-containing protein [Bacteroidota bacterium]